MELDEERKNFEDEQYFFHYHSPFSLRYASIAMSYNFSEHNKFVIWRKLWYNLAKAQRDVGVNISKRQLEDIHKNIYLIDFDECLKEEKLTRNHVKAHLKVFSTLCKESTEILNLGVPFTYITENTPLILYRDAFNIIIPKLATAILDLCAFTLKYNSQPTLGYVHLQPTQLTTMGKRSSIWIQDLYACLTKMDKAQSNICFGGIQGISGSQEGILALLKERIDKVQQLEQLLMVLSDFNDVYTLCGQTYPRITDYDCMAPLSRLGSSLAKICSDIRLLFAIREIEDNLVLSGNEDTIIYRSNLPTRCERCCSLSRHLIGLIMNPLQTAANQWLERSMDDSANLRISMTEAFITADMIIDTFQDIIKNISVNTEHIDEHVDSELNIFISKDIARAMAMRGSDREECSDRLANISEEVFREGSGDVKISFKKRVMADKYFSPLKEDFPSLFNPFDHFQMYTTQVEEYIEKISNSLQELSQRTPPIKTTLEFKLT